MSTTVLSFGKYKGQTLDQVLLVDPDYFRWLQSQTEMLRARPDIARAFSELGVTGDETPLHNSVQALFLKDVVCERLARRLWPENADQVIRDRVLAGRRKRLLDAILMEREERDYRQISKRARLLKLCTQLRRNIEELHAAICGTDDQLAAARDAAFRQICGPRPPGLANILLTDGKHTLRKQANEQLSQAVRRHNSIRTELAEMKASLRVARQEDSRLTPKDIAVRFRVESRRTEETNGSDVRITCCLSAHVPEGFSHVDDISWQKVMWVEIKPFLGDDYPTLLRQLEIQRKAAGSRSYEVENEFVAVIGRYGGQGATMQQLRQIFSESRFRIVLLEELGHQMPSVTSSRFRTEPLPLLPLFQTME